LRVSAGEKTTGEIRRTGLGLAIVKKFINLMGAKSSSRVKKVKLEVHDYPADGTENSDSKG